MIYLKYGARVGTYENLNYGKFPQDTETSLQRIYKGIRAYMGIVKYTPNENDIRNLWEIREFFNDRNIKFKEDTDVVGLFHLNEGKLQVRYVNSSKHRMDASKRFGDIQKGIPKDYFINISQEEREKGIRVIWIYDFEMEQHNTIIDEEGVERTDYRRQWEVLKNYINYACGKVDHRYYARECELREITNKDARAFLNTHCFYGHRNATHTFGLFAKKDKNGIKAGTLLYVYSFGHCYYANKNHTDNPIVEIIRVSTKIGCQVIGAASKIIKHFVENYKTIKFNKKEYPVTELRFFVDAAHNSSQSLDTLGFEFVSWDGCGFKNYATDDIEIPQLSVKKNQIFERKPQIHKKIMELMGEGKIIAIANAGTIVYRLMVNQTEENNNNCTHLSK